jgi:CRISPR/Cas system-associated protein Cas10 (large subunit of type III CRISPR-Cas system)
MKKLYYIDYPQEHVEGHAHTYRCALCKVLTTTINGTLEGHLPICDYRSQLESAGYEANKLSKHTEFSSADDYD